MLAGSMRTSDLQTLCIAGANPNEGSLAAATHKSPTLSPAAYSIEPPAAPLHVQQVKRMLIIAFHRGRGNGQLCAERWALWGVGR